MKRTLFALLLAAVTAAAFAFESQRVTLINAATGTGAGTSVNMGRTAAAGGSAGSGVVENVPYRTFQASGTTSAGSGAATIKVQVNTGGTAIWLDACTITLTLGTGETSDGCTMLAPWPLVRGNVTAISGTNAAVSLWMGL